MVGGRVVRGGVLVGLLVCSGTCAAGDRLESLREKLVSKQRERERAGTLAEIQAAPRGGSLQDLRAPTEAATGDERAGLAAMILAAPTAAPGAAPAAAPSAAAPSPGGQPTHYQLLLHLVNDARSRPQTCGDTAMPAVPPLALDATLVRVAAAHSAEMGRDNWFSHTSKDGRSPWTRIQEGGYPGRGVAENIAMPWAKGVSLEESARKAFGQWMESSGHCRNIMTPRGTQMGVGVFRPATGASDFWTQVFAQPK